MTKEQIKNYCKEHKDEIAIACCNIVGLAGIGYYLWRVIKADAEWTKFRENLKWAAGDGKMYVPGNAEELIELIGRDTIQCGKNNETLKITGCLIFGNKVDG